STLVAGLVVDPAGLDGEAPLPVTVRTWAPGRTERPQGIALVGVVRSRPADVRVTDGAPARLVGALGEETSVRLEVPVRNDGGTTAAAPQAVVTATGLPDGAVVRGAPGDGWECLTQGPAELRCYSAGLRPGEDRPVLLDVVARPTDLAEGTGLVDVASDAVVEVRVAGGDDVGTVPVRVESAPAALRTQVVAPGSPVTTGTVRSLHVRVTNDGATTARAVPVVVGAPEPLVASGAGWGACDAGLCQDVTVAPGGTVDLTVDLTASSAPPGSDRSVTVRVTVAGQESTTAVRVVGPRLVVSVAPTTTLTPGVPGEVPVTVRNEGGEVEEVALEVVLPNAAFLVPTPGCAQAQGSNLMVTCEVGRVAPQESVRVDVGVRAMGAAAGREILVGVRGADPSTRVATTIRMV
ncbi:MAG: hypothetical protein H5T83_06225, partial [Actinotalea sp.]|nr:hypothetical protein [Actinotalea sp.]